jgi:hypothetical protein
MRFPIPKLLVGWARGKTSFTDLEGQDREGERVWVGVGLYHLQSRGRDRGERGVTLIVNESMDRSEIRRGRGEEERKVE